MLRKLMADTEWNMLVSGEYDLLNTNWMTVQDGDPYGYLDNWYGKQMLITVDIKMMNMIKYMKHYQQKWMKKNVKI